MMSKIALVAAIAALESVAATPNKKAHFNELENGEGRHVLLHEAPPSKCDAALQSLCGSDMGTAGACVACAGDNQQVLRAAGCSEVQIQAWCEAQYPFGGSHLIKTRGWATTLNTWAGFGNSTQWSLCCSTFEGCDNATKFHAACDAHAPTLTVAHNAGRPGSNPGNFTFGGFAAGSWSVDACCAANFKMGREKGCHDPAGNLTCDDRRSSSDWLFGLWPGPPQRFEPTGTDTNYQWVTRDWPWWGLISGGADLVIGHGAGAPGGVGGRCTQGTTYRGTDGEICGGTHNWGATDVEVWYPR